MDGLKLPDGELYFKINGKWESCAITDGGTKESILRMNESIWHFPIGTECRYTWNGRTLEFTIDRMNPVVKKPRIMRGK